MSGKEEDDDQTARQGERRRSRGDDNGGNVSQGGPRGGRRQVSKTNHNGEKRPDASRFELRMLVWVLLHEQCNALHSVVVPGGGEVL